MQGEERYEGVLGGVELDVSWVEYLFEYSESFPED